MKRVNWNEANSGGWGEGGGRCKEGKRRLLLTAMLVLVRGAADTYFILLSGTH